MYLLLPAQCGFATSLMVVRCAHSLKLTHSLNHSLHTFFSMHVAYMSPACAGIGMESMVARMRHGCVMPCGSRPTWLPRWRPRAARGARARGARARVSVMRRPAMRMRPALEPGARAAPPPQRGARGGRAAELPPLFLLCCYVPIFLHDSYNFRSAGTRPPPKNRYRIKKAYRRMEEASSNDSCPGG